MKLRRNSMLSDFRGITIGVAFNDVEWINTIFSGDMVAVEYNSNMKALFRHFSISLLGLPK